MVTNRFKERTMVLFENTSEKRLMICRECGRHYWVEPTGNLWEWRVTLATGETVTRMVAAQPNLKQTVEAALTGVMNTQWYVAQFTPIQVQASVDPLCHIAECVVSPTGGYLEETYMVY